MLFENAKYNFNYPLSNSNIKTFLKDLNLTLTFHCLGFYSIVRQIIYLLCSFIGFLQKIAGNSVAKYKFLRQKQQSILSQLCRNLQSGNDP